MESGESGAAVQFNALKESGVYFGSDEQAITDFIETHFPGFDLGQLLEELDAVASAWGFGWNRKDVRIGGYGGLIIHHQCDDEDGTEEGSLTLKRILKQPAGSVRRVLHDEMFVPVELQDQGLSRALNTPYYKQYQNADVNFIDATAGDKGGGYALAAYGFAAVNRDEVFTVIQQGPSRGIATDDMDILKEEVEDFYSVHPNDPPPFPIWEWAEIPFSKVLLRGTYWKAVLNLQDESQKSTFELYLYSSKRAKTQS